MRWVSDLEFRVPEVSALSRPCPSWPAPQELTEAQSALRVQAAELSRAQDRQEEFLQRLWEAQEREAATASQIQALSSQLEEAWVVRREVSDDRGRGECKDLGPRCWGPHVPVPPCVAGVRRTGPWW